MMRKSKTKPMRQNKKKKNKRVMVLLLLVSISSHRLKLWQNTSTQSSSILLSKYDTNPVILLKSVEAVFIEEGHYAECIWGAILLDVDNENARAVDKVLSHYVASISNDVGCRSKDMEYMKISPEVKSSIAL